MDPVELDKLMMQEREGIIVGHRQEGLESSGQVEGLEFDRSKDTTCIRQEDREWGQDAG